MQEHNNQPAFFVNLRNNSIIKQQTVMTNNKLITLLAALLTGITAMAQSTVGSWTGKLDVMGSQLNLVFNITEADGGGLACTMDSPDQGVKGIPAEITVDGGTKVKISITALMAEYEGELKDGMIKGTFRQSGMSFPLELKPGTVNRNRPQTPAEPYPYKTEEVTFSNDADNVTLAGTLTYPTGFDKMKTGSVPVVIMVTGSGQQNRDEEVFDHKPFLVIADYLARNGIATLRYDDRGTGKSTGDPAAATTENNMKDALAAVDFARGTSRFSRVGVLGHSEGGSIAFMLGARGKADFIVSMAGPGVSGADILTAQNRLLLTQSGVPSDITDAYCKALAAAFAAITSTEATTDPNAKAQEIVRQSGVSLPEPLVQNLAKVLASCTPWLKYFIAYDTSADIKAVKCPVLAVNGDKDTQVISADNLTAIRSLLPEGGLNTVKEYPGLNHLFQHCSTGQVTEYAQIEETISPEVLKDIADWINKTK